MLYVAIKREIFAEAQNYIHIHSIQIFYPKKLNLKITDYKILFVFKTKMS